MSSVNRSEYERREKEQSDRIDQLVKASTVTTQQISNLTTQVSLVITIGKWITYIVGGVGVIVIADFVVMHLL